MPLRRRRWRSGRSTSTTRTRSACRCRVSPSPYEPGLRCRPGRRAEVLSQPAASCGRRSSAAESSRPEECPSGVHCTYLDLELLIDAAGDASCQSAHCHPFVGLGWVDTTSAGRWTGQRRACVRQAPILSLRPTGRCRVGPHGPWPHSCVTGSDVRRGRRERDSGSTRRRVRPQHTVAPAPVPSYGAPDPRSSPSVPTSPGQCSVAVPTGGPTLDRRTSAPSVTKATSDGVAPNIAPVAGRAQGERCLTQHSVAPDQRRCQRANWRKIDQASGSGVARQVADCVIFCGRLGLDGGPALCRQQRERRERQISPCSAASPPRCPSFAPRFRLTDSGHRLLEIRRATHSLNRSHLVFMVPTVHLAAADLPPYPAHGGVRSVRVANHRQ